MYVFASCLLAEEADQSTADRSGLLKMLINPDHLFRWIDAADASTTAAAADQSTDVVAAADRSF